MRRLIFLILACGTQGDGQRCNPLRATPDCNAGLTCVFPSGPNCGVPYCCKVDAQGNIVDDLPTCQPDPQSVAACSDLGVPTD
jgi:hypothetical protein